MKKNFKKCLSYVLGVVLAMGLGLSYAYAVGANDSNAFVTTTEWEQRVAQIEASLDNVNKTINDTNMDFVMNGPRIQVGLNEGMENTGGFLGRDFFGTYYGQYRSTSYNSVGSRMSQMNAIQISDQLDGRQAISIPFWYGGDTNNNLVRLRLRFALKSSNDPNVYLVVSWYAGEANRTADPYTWPFELQYVYYDLSNLYTDYSSAKTVEVTLPLSEWWPMKGDAPPTSLARRSSNIYTGKVGNDTAFPDYLYLAAGNSNTSLNLSNPGQGYITTTVTSTDATYKFEFPAGANIIRDCNNGNNTPSWQMIPLDMRGRKFGNCWDRLTSSSNTALTERTARVVAKVYSPQKGCLALKSFVNGEVPILNE